MKVGHPYPRNTSVCPHSCAAAEMAGGRVTALSWDLLNQMILGTERGKCCGHKMG